jgi:hypothetical protein
VKPVGKPDAGNPHVRFDERGGETGRAGDTAPLLDSTRKFRTWVPWRMLVGSGFWGPAGVDRVQGNHFERDVILWGVRWYVAYPISYRQLEEMMEERGVEVDHSTPEPLGAQVCPAA